MAVTQAAAVALDDMAAGLKSGSNGASMCGGFSDFLPIGEYMHEHAPVNMGLTRSQHLSACLVFKHSQPMGCVYVHAAKVLPICAPKESVCLRFSGYLPGL